MKQSEKIISLLLSLLILLGTGALSVFAEEDHPTWGTRSVIQAPDGVSYPYYVEPDGTFSTEIAKDGITWLYTESFDRNNGAAVTVSRWIGLSNPKDPFGTPLFKPGDRFCVSIIEKDSPRFQELFNRLDPVVKRTSDFLTFLHVSVYREDGTAYTSCKVSFELFLSQDPEASGEISGSLVGIGTDESVSCQMTWLPLSGIPCPAEGPYSVFRLNHLDAILALSNESEDGSVRNAASIIAEPSVISVAVVSFAAGAAVSAVAVLVLTRKKRSKAE